MTYPNAKHTIRVERWGAVWRQDRSSPRRRDGGTFQVVSAQIATGPDLPEALHYMGDGVFATSGKTISHRNLFRPRML
jgi:hypothetical protein